MLVLGTGTEVGKTWVTAALIGRLRAAGLTVAARKPAQSFDEGTGPTDAEVLGAASGEPPGTVCPPARWYGRALAPPMAADALARPVPTLAELVGELVWPEPAVQIGLVEAAGGVRSPMASDGDGVDLAERLRPDRIVLVADAGLGTINAVRLSVAALGPGQAPEPVVVLNRFDGTDLHRRNEAWLRGHDGLDVVTGDDAGLAVLAAALARGAGAPTTPSPPPDGATTPNR